MVTRYFHSLLARLSIYPTNQEYSSDNQVKYYEYEDSFNSWQTETIELAERTHKSDQFF